MARKQKAVKKTKKKTTKRAVKKAPKLPKTLGACADKLYSLRELRFQATKVVDIIKEQELVLTEHLIAKLDKSDADGVKGRVAKANITTKIVATVSDWPKFYKHILKTKDFSLMQRRANDAACRERWGAKKKIPGVVSFNVLKVSLTKA